MMTEWFLGFYAVLVGCGLFFRCTECLQATLTSLRFLKLTRWYGRSSATKCQAYRVYWNPFLQHACGAELMIRVSKEHEHWSLSSPWQASQPLHIHPGSLQDQGFLQQPLRLLQKEDAARESHIVVPSQQRWLRCIHRPCRNGLANFIGERYLLLSTFHHRHLVYQRQPTWISPLAPRRVEHSLTRLRGKQCLLQQRRRKYLSHLLESAVCHDTEFNLMVPAHSVIKRSDCWCMMSSFKKVRST